MSDSSDGRPLVEGVDFYMEGPYMVFTEAFLKRRGYCCESGCRHCPWGFDPARRAEPVNGPGEPGHDPSPD